MKFPFPRRRLAFTLIELLVVIAIIAILAAILFPVFARARENARRASCQSNLKQLGIMMMQYTQDYDELFPRAYYGTSATGTTDSWITYVQPYIKSQQVFMCPSQSDADGMTYGAAFTNHYAYNFYIGGNGSGTLNKPLPAFVKPAETILITDSGAVPTTGVSPEKWPLKTGLDANGKKRVPYLLLHAGSSTVIKDTTSNPPYGAPMARHLETCNVLWADGHVKALRVDKIYTSPGQEVASKPATVTQANWSPCLDPAFGCSYLSP